MSFLTFTAPSLEEAKQSMRAELGAGAVILATKRRGDGKVEIRAIQKGMPLFEGEGPAMVAAKPKATKSALRGLAARRSNQVKNDPPLQSASNGMRLNQRIERNASESALSALRGDMSQKLGQDADGFADNLHRMFHQKLAPHGVSANLVKALVNECRDIKAKNEIDLLAQGFERVLRFTPLAIAPDVPIMLLGQTGAGKTSCSAKLAARAAGSGEGVKAAFLCADIGRAGAIAQMQTYADALDTRFWQISSPEDVSDILKQERPQEILILDTPGVSPYAAADIAVMKAFRDAVAGEPILVLPASGDMNEHIDWAKAFAEIGARRCIITKFDTSRRIGAAISAAFEANLSLAHFSEAPFIADGLIDASPDYLAHRLLLEEPARIAGTY